MKKDIRTLLDLTRKDFERFFKSAVSLKKKYRKGTLDRSLEGKCLGLLFDKHSTRTRVSFESAMVQLGGMPLYISTSDTQMARKEPIRDTARVMARYINGLAIRTFSQDFLEEFAEHASIPVINALTDMYHPCQVMSDLMTVLECKGGLEKVKIVWVGDGNNVAHSWINAAAVLNLNLVLACPDGYMPDQRVVDTAESVGKYKVNLTNDPVEAVRKADVVYTDVWASMGQEDESRVRKKIFASFQVNQELMKHAKKDAVVMHCLPAHRGEEISSEVLEGPASVVWEQAENKMHMHRAILAELLGGKKN